MHDLMRKRCRRQQAFQTNPDQGICCNMKSALSETPPSPISTASAPSGDQKTRIVYIDEGKGVGMLAVIWA